MPVVVYGQQRTRASRPLWMARELGVAVVAKPMVLMDATMDRLNPNRKAPAAETEDCIL